MSQTKAQLLDNIKDNVQLDARNALRFADTDSSHYVAFKAPATVSSNVTWTLPAADGSANYVLATDGSGTLSWIADPAGQWVTSGSNIYFTGGNVGIGDTSPSNPLSVTGASAFNGDVTFTGASYNVTWDKSADDLIFADNAKAAFGTSSDLTLYHDGSNSYIKDTGTGLLAISASALNITNAAGTEDGIKFVENGAVSLYYDNSKRLETTSGGIDVAGSGSFTSHIDINSDSGKLRLGNANDLEIYHDGTVNRIDSYEDLIIRKGASEDMAKFINNGAVELYNNSGLRFKTLSNGARIVGAEGGNANLEFYADEGDDNADKWNIYASTGGFLAIKNYASGSWETSIECNNNGAVELYYDNSKKFETTAGGVTITGTDASDGTIIKGDLRLNKEGETTTKIKWDGSEGTDGNLEIFDDVKLTFGASADLEIFHDGSNSYINETGTGDLIIDSSHIVFKDGGTEVLETTNSGIRLKDDKILAIGSGSDLQIYHDTSSSAINRIRCTNGHLFVDVEDSMVISVQADANGENGEVSAKFLESGAAELYYNGTKVFETITNGIWASRAASGTQTDPQLALSGSGYTSHHWLDGTAYYLGQNSNSRSVRVFSGSDATAGAQLSNGNTSWTTFSDERLKEDIKDIGSVIDKVKDIRCISYKRKNLEGAKETIGFIAQDFVGKFDQVLDQSKLKDDDTDDYYGIKYTETIPILLKAIQELSAKVTALEGA